MNKDNILAVADAIEGHKIPGLGFNMGTWMRPTGVGGLEDLSGNNCGTIACIGGWTGEIFPASGGAAAALGLSQGEADELFAPKGWSSGSSATSAQAVRVLRHLAETGEVRWDLATQDEVA